MKRGDSERSGSGSRVKGVQHCLLSWRLPLSSREEGRRYPDDTRQGTMSHGVWRPPVSPPPSGKPETPAPETRSPRIPGGGVGKGCRTQRSPASGMRRQRAVCQTDARRLGDLAAGTFSSFCTWITDRAEPTLDFLPPPWRCPFTSSFIGFDSHRRWSDASSRVD